MLVAALAGVRGSVDRDVEFSRGVFIAEGLGEISVSDLHDFDASGQLSWISDDVRQLALGYSADSPREFTDDGHFTDSQLALDVETEVVYVPPQRMGTKTEAELQHIVDEMTSRGWVLVEDTRVGAAGGHLTFHRADPIDAEFLQSLSHAG